MGQATKSVQTIHAALSDYVESHLYTGNAGSLDFVRTIKTLRPEVIHLHGCWNIQLAIAHRIASHYGIPVITSPHGGLMPKVIQTDFWKKRLPRIVAYQFFTIRNSFTLHACSAKEYDELKSLGWRKRITAVNVTKAADERKTMVDDLCALYNKVIDTTWRNRLKPEEHKCFWALLGADIAAGYSPSDLSDETTKLLSELTPNSWKAMQVYALDHGVHTRLLTGAQSLGITIPKIISQPPARYSYKAPWRKGQPSAVSPEVIAKYREHATELSLATKIHDLYITLSCCYETDNCPHSVVHLLDIYEVMRWKYYDEPLLAEIIKEMGMTTFCSRLLTVLNVLLDLQIGYMPIDPKSDRSVNKLIKNLNNLP